MSKKQLEKIEEMSIFRPKIGSLAGLNVFKKREVKVKMGLCSFTLLYKSKQNRN